MPPKAAAKHQKDWSWADTLSSADAITLSHRRAAAGLGPNTQKACVIVKRKEGRKSKSPDKGNGLLRALSERNGNGKRAISVDSTGTDASVVFVKEMSCTAKRCAGNPRCYNHLGMDKWWKEGARESYARDKLGEEIRERDGPAGLKNYGATCYANAFLQVWFNNVAFRNGVYEAVGEQVNHLYHLANIFAMMQESRRPVVDPGALIEALRLNKGNQQDAAEFSKLFMTLVADGFKRNGGPLANFVNEQFEGAWEYTTKCNTCGYKSSTTSKFLEIEVPLQDKCTLDNQLRSLLTPELMDGSNKYKCPECDSLQPATRSTNLKELPPVLHFALNRFEYSAYSDQRKKSKARITYPRELQVGDKTYDLRGVVVHEGANAYHGHFTCEVFNEDENDWYFCSDDDVRKLSDRPRKKIKLDPDAVDEQVSRDAYMLVYQMRRPTKPIPRPPPAHLKDTIEADNTVVYRDIAERMDRLMAFGEEFDAMVAAKEAMLDIIEGDDHVVSRECLAEWFAADSLQTKWIVPKSLICTHGQYNPSANGFRVISSAAFDKLEQYFDEGMARRNRSESGSAPRSNGDKPVDERKSSAPPPAANGESSSEAATPKAPSVGHHETVSNGVKASRAPPPEGEPSSSNELPAHADKASSAPPIEQAGVSSNGAKASTAPPLGNGEPLSTGAKAPGSPSVAHPDGSSDAHEVHVSPPAVNGNSSSKTSRAASNAPTERDKSMSMDVDGPAEHGQPNGTASQKDEPQDEDVQFVSSQPATFPDLDICHVCVREEFERLVGNNQRAEYLDAFKRANEGGGKYLLPRSWLMAWRKGTLGPLVSPADPEYSLFCDHENPFPEGKKTEGISEEAVMLLRSILGDFPVFEDGAQPCEECSAVHAVSQVERASWQAQVKPEEKLLKQHHNQTHVFGLVNYILPRGFFEKWKKYLSEPVERPTLELELCPHGLLDFDPAMDKTDYLTGAGWKELCRLYEFPPDEGVSVKFASQPAASKRLAVHNPSKETCQECRSARLSAWEEMWLPIVVGENEVPDDNDGSRRRTLPRGRKGKEAQLKVDKATTIKHIRLELYEMFKVSPLSQRLLFKGRELSSDETIGGIGVLLGDHINLVEVVEVDDFEIGRGHGDEGFGGTALVGQKSCPHCTLLNDPGASTCAVCGLPI